MDSLRSSQPQVRNPVMALPSAQRLAALDPETRAIVADLLKELAVDARARADKAWRTHKGPMAWYWKAVSVYARHISRYTRKGLA